MTVQLEAQAPLQIGIDATGPGVRILAQQPLRVDLDNHGVADVRALVARGPEGPAGVGVPAGGTVGQVLAKNSGTDYDTEWVTGGGSGGGDPNAAVYGANVKNPAYGAEGDGTTDDTAAIQAAIDDAGSVAGGATVFFPAGIYIISDSLVVPSGVYLLGAGMGNTIIRAAASSTMDAMVTTATDQLNWIVTITDLQLDGNRNNSASVDNGILWFGASDSSIERVRVVQIAGNGIRLTGGAIPLLGTAVTLDDVRIRGCDEIGILNDTFSTDTAIVNCDVGQCDDHAIYLAGSNSSVTATRAWGSLTGLYVAGQIIRVSGGSRFDFNQLNGMVIAGDEVQVSATQVHSNSVAADGVHAGIEVGTGAGRVQISGVRSWNSDIPDAGVQSYGLKLASGRVGPALVLSCDFSGNDSGDIDHTTVAGDLVAPGAASTTMPGVVRLSTGAEAIALTDPDSAISPDTLNDALVNLDYASDAALTAHIDDTTDAHDASAISTVPAGNLAATNVQASLAELDGEKATAAQGALADSAVQPGDLATVATTGDYDDLTDKPTLGTAAAQNTGFFATAAQGATADTAASGLAAHIGDTSDAHDASAISFTPAGTIAATDVQAAIEEVAAEAGGGGTVDTVVAGTNIDVDSTDPANPIVSVETLTLADISDVTASTAEVNVLDGVTASTAELNILDGVTATAAELNVTDGLTASTAELNHVDGVTSPIQTQLNGKATTAQGALADSAVQPGDLADIATSGSASDLDAGTVPTARLGSGAANGTTFLAGDQTYKETPDLDTLAGGTTANGDFTVPYTESGVWTVGTPLPLDTLPVGFASSQVPPGNTVARNTLGGAEVSAAASGTSGTVTLDCSAASIFTLSPSGNVTTLTISNPPASGTACTITLIVIQGATPRTIATPTGGVFLGAASPTQVANKRCAFTYLTVDGGTVWHCSAAVQV